MKTTINHLLGAALPLLVTFSISQSASAQTTARIAFRAPVTDRKGQTTYQIFAMNSDKTGATQLTRSGGAWPSWSSNQKYIAFQRAGTIYVMDAAKGESKGGRTFPVVQASGSGHDWAPDDTAILYTGTEAIGYGLWLVSVNPATGAVGTPILLRQGPCWDPNFSPDGTKIAYSSGGRRARSRPGHTGGKHASPKQQRSELESRRDQDRFRWGRVLRRHGELPPRKSSSRIQTAPAWTPVTALQDYSSFPAWSPDGTELVFYSQVSGSKAMYKTTIGSGTMTLLYNGAELGADWVP